MSFKYMEEFSCLGGGLTSIGKLLSEILDIRSTPSREDLVDQFLDVDRRETTLVAGCFHFII